jgi:hypothetical protein
MNNQLIRLIRLYLSILSVPDEGYSERHLMKVILSVTWWRLFQKCVARTKFDIYVLLQFFLTIVYNVSCSHLENNFCVFLYIANKE